MGPGLVEAQTWKKLGPEEWKREGPNCGPQGEGPKFRAYVHFGGPQHFKHHRKSTRRRPERAHRVKFQAGEGIKSAKFSAVRGRSGGQGGSGRGGSVRGRRSGRGVFCGGGRRRVQWRTGKILISNRNIQKQKNVQKSKTSKKEESQKSKIPQKTNKNTFVFFFFFFQFFFLIFFLFFFGELFCIFVIFVMFLDLCQPVSFCIPKKSQLYPQKSGTPISCTARIWTEPLWGSTFASLFVQLEYI